MLRTCLPLATIIPFICLRFDNKWKRTSHIYIFIVCQNIVVIEHVTKLFLQEPEIDNDVDETIEELIF